MVKALACLRRKPGMSTDEFHRYWKEKHGPLVKSVPEFFGYFRKYVQSHTTVDRIPGFPPQAAPPYDGIAEIWFDSVEDVGKAFSEPRYLEVIRPDEEQFLDLPNCNILIAEEVTM